MTTDRAAKDATKDASKGASADATDATGAAKGAAVAFAQYRRWYPNTPALEAGDGGDATARYEALWRAVPTGVLPWRRDAHHVLVRGLYGARLPGHFREARAALAGAGLRVDIAPTAPVGCLEENRATLARWLGRVAPDGAPLILLAHSRGGLETLLALASTPALGERVAAVVLCQTARSASPALAEMLTGRRLPDRLWRLAIAATGGLAACREVGDPATAARARALDDGVSRWPVYSVATWSSRPSPSLELQHRRMARLQPGIAHDGLFRTADLIWPTARQVLLGGIDHSQPGVGGGGFDSGRFWLALAALAAGDGDGSGGRARPLPAPPGV